MGSDYDSWRDEIPAGRDDIERGHGYALGGSGRFQPVRGRQRWRVAAIDRARMALIDLTLLVACALSAWIAFLAKSVPLLVICAVAVTFTMLWFHHQRIERERRPR